MKGRAEGRAAARVPGNTDTIL